MSVLTSSGLLQSCMESILPILFNTQLLFGLDSF
jgi:hypothetical protein